MLSILEPESAYIAFIPFNLNLTFEPAPSLRLGEPAAPRRLPRAARLQGDPGRAMAGSGEAESAS